MKDICKETSDYISPFSGAWHFKITSLQIYETAYETAPMRTEERCRI
jgi:hypothetical protein